jgi:hypothetical protein
MTVCDTATFLNLFRNRIERRPPARRRCETRGVKSVLADSMKSISLDTLVRETRTDSAGRFRFVNVPTGRSWWFALPESRDLRSDSLTVTDSGEQQVRLRRIDRGSESVLELALPGE